jgi:hypothetical protein
MSNKIILPDGENIKSVNVNGKTMVIITECLKVYTVVDNVVTLVTGEEVKPYRMVKDFHPF